MQKSESIKNIAGALITFHMKVENIKKDATNPFFKKKYASLSNILESIQIPLSESGLAFSQFPTGPSDLSTILMHADSGEYMIADYTMEAPKNDPQSKGSAMTYQRRYALTAILGLNIDDDDDGNAASAAKNGATNPARQGCSDNNGRPAAAKDNTGPNDLPWLNDGSKEYDGALAKLKAGTTTIPKIKTVMRISKATEAKLMEAIKK